MLIYKIFRPDEWRALAAEGRTDGAAVDRADGYIHFSTAAQVEETAARHFAADPEVRLVAVEAEALGPDLRWEVSRGGQPFPHLYRALTLGDVAWSRPVRREAGGLPFGPLG